MSNVTSGGSAARTHDWQVGAITTPGAAPDGTAMDTVELLVRDLDSMTTFYSEAVTLDVMQQSGATAVLGQGTTPIMVLKQEKDLPDRDPRGAGLYHTAIVFEHQARLATSLASMAQRAAHLYEGSADHYVSEAFYFHDPEGNGLELYRDRRRDEWNYGPDGRVTMGSAPLDPNRFLRDWYNPNMPGSGDTAAVGHVHLQVGDIARGREFYVDILGFDMTFEMPTALFLSAGGYHHHIGMNTWQSRGAGPRAASLGLGNVRISVPTRDDALSFKERLDHARVQVADDGAAIHFEDPWGTKLVITPSQT